MAAGPTRAAALLGGLACATDTCLALAWEAFADFYADAEAKTLAVRGMRITTLPGAFFAAPEVAARLAGFDCSANEMTTLPAELGQLSALTRLACNSCRLTSLGPPGSKGRLDALVSVACDSNALAAFPAELGPLPRLRLLACGFNELTELEFSGVEGLETLACNNNRLTSLDGLARAAALRVFDCGYNHLAPQNFAALDLSQLAALETFGCYGNGLTALPAGLGRLPRLRVVRCSHNRLAALPPGFGPRLRHLDCSHNCLAGLPAELGRSPGLKWLDCRHNGALGGFWEGLAAGGERDHKALSPEILGPAWSARWAAMASRRVKAARQNT